MIEIDNKTMMLEQVLYDYTMEIVGKINEIGNILLIIEEDYTNIDFSSRYVKEFQHKIYAWQKSHFNKLKPKEEK